MKLSLFIPLMWLFCTALPSSLSEHASQSRATSLPNLKSRILSDRDDLVWTDDFFNPDAITNDAGSAPDADADADNEGLFAEQGASWDNGPENYIDGQDHDDSIREESPAALTSADSLVEGSCSAASHPPAKLKIRRRDDASCPAPEVAPLSPKNPDAPSFPNLMDQSEQRLPIDVPLFKLNHNDELECDGLGYNKHLCCDGPCGPWIDRWSHYDFVLNCLPCTVDDLFSFSPRFVFCFCRNTFILRLSPSIAEYASFSPYPSSQEILRSSLPLMLVPFISFPSQPSHFTQKTRKIVKRQTRNNFSNKPPSPLKITYLHT